MKTILSLLIGTAFSKDWFDNILIPTTPLLHQFNEIEEDRTYNVLVSSVAMGSMLKTIDDMAIDLSNTKWPNGRAMFNVTIITYPNNKKINTKRGKTLHPIRFDYDPEKLAKDSTGSAILNHENKLIEDFVLEKDYKIIQKIKEKKYDVGLTSFLPT